LRIHCAARRQCRSRRAISITSRFHVSRGQSITLARSTCQLISCRSRVVKVNRRVRALLRLPGAFPHLGKLQFRAIPSPRRSDGRAGALIAIRRNAIASFHVVKCPTSLPFCITAIKTSPRRKPRQTAAAAGGGRGGGSGRLLPLRTALRLAPCALRGFRVLPSLRDAPRGRVSLSRAHARVVPRRSFLSSPLLPPHLRSVPPVTGPQQFATYGAPSALPAITSSH